MKASACMVPLQCMRYAARCRREHQSSTKLQSERINKTCRLYNSSQKLSPQPHCKSCCQTACRQYNPSYKPKFLPTLIQTVSHYKLPLPGCQTPLIPRLLWMTHSRESMLAPTKIPCLPATPSPPKYGSPHRQAAASCQGGLAAPIKRTAPFVAPPAICSPPRRNSFTAALH